MIIRPPNQLIPLNEIRNPSGFNRNKDETFVSRLADEIKRHGLRHPITVVANGDGFDLVAGLQRLSACRLNGDTEIECKVLPEGTAKAELLAISLAENAVRKNETFSEVVGRFEQIMALTGCSFSEAAKAAGVGKSFASKCRKCEEKLGPQAKKLVDDHPKKLGISIAYFVAKNASNDGQQVEWLTSILDGSQTRADLEQQVKNSGEKKSRKFNLQFDLEDFVARLSVSSSTDYDTVLKRIDVLKATISAKRKSGIPFHLLADVLKADAEGGKQ